MKRIISLFLFLACTLSAHAIDSMSALNLSNPAIVQWKIIGSCYVGQIIQHWIPVAWVETSPTGASFVDGYGKSTDKASMLRTSGHESSMSARVLNVTDSLWKQSQIANSYEKVCDISAANAGSASESTGGCSSAMNFGQFSAGGDFEEAYDSTTDPGWLTGCRDKQKVEAAVAANVHCSPDNLNSGLTSSNCLGRWGSIIPRQAREIGLIGAAASAKTAFRSMSTARHHFSRISYAVDAFGQMQQALPSMSPGFFPGTLPLPGNVTLPADRRIAWIYWRLVMCCK